MLKRKEYAVDLTLRDDPLQTQRKLVKEGEGNIYSSELAGQDAYHVPTLDIDLACELVESTTEGHFHLYIDKPMSWEDYQFLLRVLMEVGVIQKGFYELSMARKASFLRKPGVKKTDDEIGDS